MADANSTTSGKDVAILSFKMRTEGDCIDDRTFTEIIRRLEAMIQGQSQSDIWSEVTEPTDKTLIWWPKDPTSGTRIGKPKTYDPATATWIELGGNGSAVVAPLRVSGDFSLLAGDSTVNVDFTKVTGSSYHVNITPLTSSAAPANLDDFAWIITNRAVNQFTVKWYAVPTGGAMFLWEVVEPSS